jgi:integrase
MTRFRLRYMQAWVDSEGRVHRYFRRPGFPRVRLPGLPGSAEFMQAYEAALETPQLAVGAKRSKPGSVAMAIAAYLGSTDFSSHAASTQAMYRAILERFREQHGDKPLALLPPKFIALTLSKMKPHAARNWAKALRGLMQFALKLELCESDPTQGIKLARVKTDGHHTWSEAEIAAFEACHPVGSEARLALALLLYTAQRRGDVVRMGRQHISDGMLDVRQQKTGTTLAIPVHSELRAIINATPGRHLTFLVARGGRQLSGNVLSRKFRLWCDAAGLPKACSPHGLRKAACRRLAEAGCSANEIAAISGHASLREVERYTKAADQRRMARNAMARTVSEQTMEKTVKSPVDLTIVPVNSLKA